MIRPSDLNNNNNFLNLYFHNLAGEQYSYFIDFISYIEKQLLKDTNKIINSNQFKLILNEVSFMEYDYNIMKNSHSPFNNTIDPVIANKNHLIGLSCPHIRSAFKNYFEYFDWDFDVIKYPDEHNKRVILVAKFFAKNYSNSFKDYYSAVSSKCYLVDDIDNFNKSANVSVKEEPIENISVKEEPIMIPTIDIDGDYYKYLEI